MDLENSYSICFLLFSFVATQATFLASAWIIEKNKLTISDHQKKSLFYAGGITEGLLNAGYKGLLSVDFDQDCVNTHNLNHKNILRIIIYW